MELLLLVGISFAIVAGAELGDKTQLMTISLASKYHYKPVFWGIFLGMGLVTVIGVGVGVVLYNFIPVFYVKIIAASIFIIFGLYSLYSEEKEEEEEVDKDKVFHTSFLLSVVAEFGDKTQLVVIGLTARYQQPLPVLIGALAGLGVIIAMGVFLGTKISEFIEQEKIELFAALAFIILGIIFLADTLL